MAWQTPKTDWKIQPAGENGRYNGDWFNIADYNRITGNIEVLYALAQELYPGFSIVNMPDQTVSDFPYASIINNIENNLDSIVNSTWKPPGYPGKKTWYANGATPTVDDLNRIEGILLTLYSAFQRQKAVRPKLSFELKGSEF